MNRKVSMETYQLNLHFYLLIKPEKCPYVRCRNHFLPKSKHCSSVSLRKRQEMEAVRIFPRQYMCLNQISPRNCHSVSNFLASACGAYTSSPHKSYYTEEDTA